MFNLVPLLIAAALVTTTFARIDDAKVELNNKLLPNEFPAVVPIPKRRVPKKYVRISTPPPEEAVFIPGTTLVLKCEITGNPAPFAVWLKNGVPVSDYEEDSNEIFPASPFSLAHLISKFVIRSASNGDVFTCVGNSGPWQDTADTTVYVKGDDSGSLFNQLLHSKPVITAYYQDAFQVLGFSETLPCRTFSTSKTQVTWVDNKERIVYGNSRIKVLPSGDLHISGLNWEDMGNWTCSVTNAFGKGVAKTFLLPMKQSRKD